jgi:signal transduction histidine kinase
MIRSTLSKSDRLFVSVEDTGRGIDAEHADRVFAPFFTAAFHFILPANAQ